MNEITGISILLKGSGLSAFAFACAIERDEQIVLHRDPEIQTGNHPRYVFINPVTFTTLKHHLPDLASFLNEKGMAVTRHELKVAGMSSMRTNFSDAWMVDLSLLESYAHQYFPKSLKHEHTCDEFPFVAHCDGKTSSEDRNVFGSRKLVSHEVTVDVTHSTTSFFESTGDTWIYLAPTGAEKAVLQYAMPPGCHWSVEEVLAGISLSGIIKDVSDRKMIASIAPSMKRSLFEGCHLYGGDSLVSYDPISGYGLLNALRSSLLLSATIRRALHSEDEYEQVVRYYASKHILHLKDHLSACYELYSRFNPKYWGKELIHTKESIEYLDDLLKTYQPSRSYRMEAFDLKEAS